MPTCNDLRLGGTLSGTGISGGTTINGTALAVDDWTGIFGHAGISFTPVEVSGRPGGLLVGDGLGKARFPNLTMRVEPNGPNGTLTSADECQQIWDNTDDFLALLASSSGQYLEVDLPDSSKRYIRVVALDAAGVSQPFKQRRVFVPLYSPDPYWHAGGNQSTDTIVGTDTLVTAGNVNVNDAVLVFAGDGVFTHLGQNWQLTVSGSTGAVTVDLGARTVTMGGNPADQVLEPSNRQWGWFTPGNNSVDSDVSVGVTWRNQYA